MALTCYFGTKFGAVYLARKQVPLESCSLTSRTNTAAVEFTHTHLRSLTLYSIELGGHWREVRSRGIQTWLTLLRVLVYLNCNPIF